LTEFTGRCITRLAFASAQSSRFKKACAGWVVSLFPRGTPLRPPLLRAHVRLILWAGDDEFPPQSQWLFSDNMPLAFTAEDVAVMGDVIIGSLKETAKKQ
jgi:hypothetical protein